MTQQIRFCSTVNRFDQFICWLWCISRSTEAGTRYSLYKKNDPLVKTTDQLVFSLFFQRFAKKCWKYNFQISLTKLLIHICVRLGVAMDVRPPYLDLSKTGERPLIKLLHIWCCNGPLQSIWLFTSWQIIFSWCFFSFSFFFKIIFNKQKTTNKN
jgi:hypothetical protein